MLIAEYTNGNANVQLYDDGTRIIETEDNELKFDFPLNTDITITKKCDGGCPYCYMECKEDGEHADLDSFEFLNTLHSGTEMAINLNSLDHPQLAVFLKKMKDKGIIVNGTINQKHFIKCFDVLKALERKHMLWGIGISLQDPTDEFIDKVKEFPNAVVHVINGIFSGDDIEKLRDKGLKLLILGYKDVGRGQSYQAANDSKIKQRQKYLKDILPTLFSHFEVISFDNLAIEQLDVRRLFKDEEQWNEFYQGDEGSATFAIDLVEKTFSRNSMVTDKNRKYPIMATMDEMFKKIQEEIANDPSL